MSNKHLESFFFAIFSSASGKKYELYNVNWVDEETYAVGIMDHRFVIAIDTEESYDCYGDDPHQTVIKLVDENDIEYDIKLYMDSE